MQRTSNGQGGFSMIELTVAMAITLIVSGAIFGLLSGGQNAFRREPELADRQQNIRVAMDVILRDIANAGSGLPNFMQTFTPGLDACATCPMGPDGVATDQLEMVTNSGALDNEAACVDADSLESDASHLLRLRRSTTATIAPQTPVILVTNGGLWTPRNVVTATPAVPVPALAGLDCGDGTPHMLLDLGPTGDTSGLNVDGTLCGPSATGAGTAVADCNVLEVGFGELVRYQIVPDADGVPVLQRSTSANPGAGFQTLARGIEDLQVQYVTAGVDPTVPGNWTDNAPAVVPDGWATVITQVSVALSARSEAQNIQGATNAASGPAAMRGRLTASASPRSSLHVLSWQPVPSPSPSVPPQLWR